jgi:hypothetical protein
MIYPATYNIVLLQNSTFKLRLTASSSGVPINISGYVFDADICYANADADICCANADANIITSFIPSIISASSGIADLTLLPAQTADFTPGLYSYDVSATAPNGERYYWLKGNVTVSGTCSRN